MPKKATLPKAAYPVSPPMMFHAEAMTTNIAVMVASRNQSLSVSSGMPSDCSPSSEESGASTA